MRHVAISFLRSLLAPFAAWIALFLLVGLASAQTPGTQTINLQPGWNLIGFQVTPTNPDPAAVFSSGTMASVFRSAWSFDTTSTTWRRYVLPSLPRAADENNLPPLKLPPIEVGKGYWVFIAGNSISWTVSGTFPASVPGLDLQKGWNLINIPVGNTTGVPTEPISLLSVLAAAGMDYDAILTWETSQSQYKKMFNIQDTTNPLSSIPADSPFPNFDLTKDPSRGYWLRVTDPAVLRPNLIVTVRPDVDAEPLNNFPAAEDLNVSRAIRAGSTAVTPKNVQVQDTISFFAGEDVQTIGISNSKSDAGPGGGIMIWEAVWTPLTDITTPEPWIRLFASPAARERRDSAGALLAPADYTTLRGVTTLETDLVYLRLDHKNLGRGQHRGELKLRTSVGDRTYTVIADVGGLEGDWKGYATITTVNGKRNPVPDIDLFVSFYEDLATPGLLRGYIDRTNSVLWPSDVPLVGYRLADLGNRFVLGGSFVMPPGDQNGEPFDQFSDTVPAAGQDADWNNNGILDAANPFPFPIQRTVSFDGSPLTGNPTDGYVIEGDYQEVVHGMTREPLKLIGRFRLERQSSRAMSARRLDSSVSDTGIQPVVQVTNATGLNIPGNSTAGSSRGITVATEMALRSLQVSLKLRSPTSPLLHTRFIVKLRSPNWTDGQGVPRNGVEVVLYDGTTTTDRVTPALFESITFPQDRPTRGNLNTFLATVPRTRVTATANLLDKWTLSIQNLDTLPIVLDSWTLRLEGQPVLDVQGEVRASTGTPIQGATVALAGVPFSAFASAVTDATGRFTFLRLPLLPLNFTATVPGYASTTPASPGLAGEFLRPFAAAPGLTFTSLETSLLNRFNPLSGAPVAGLGVDGFAAGTSAAPFVVTLVPPVPGPVGIIASPVLGSAPLSVAFYAVGVGASDPVLWTFGDGQTATEFSPTHAYGVGHYRVELRSPASVATPTAQTTVVVMPTVRQAPTRPSAVAAPVPSTNTTPYVAYLFQPTTWSAGSIPATKSGVHPTTGADVWVSALAPTLIPLNASPVKVPYTSLQLAYSASSDYDLAPVAPGSHLFDDDTFDASAGAFTSADFRIPLNENDQGFKQEDFNYALVTANWLNTRAADGQREYPADPNAIVWGSRLSTPPTDYSMTPLSDLNNQSYPVIQDDAVFNPSRLTSTHTDADGNVATINHYRLTCSIGATGGVFTAPTPPASVKKAKLRRSDPDNPLDPELTAGAAPEARNLYYILHTGALDAQPVASVGSTPSPITLQLISRGAPVFDGTSTRLTASFVGTPSRTYAMEYKEKLTDPAWLSAGSVFTGPAGSFQITLTASGDRVAPWTASLFFRAVANR